MPAGVELYRDGAANPYFSTALAAGFILGGVDLTPGASNTGSLTDADFLNGTPFYFLNGGGAQAQPTVSFSGSTMSWIASSDGAFYTGRLCYGIR